MRFWSCARSEVPQPKAMGSGASIRLQPTSRLQAGARMENSSCAWTSSRETTQHRFGAWLRGGPEHQARGWVRDEVRQSPGPRQRQSNASVSNARKARLRESPREGPESGRKRAFRCEPEIGSTDRSGPYNFKASGFAWSRGTGVQDRSSRSHRRVNSAAWSFTKSAMLVGVSPVSLR